MAEIKLTRRVKYAGDIVNGLIDAGWDFERAILFVNNLPDAKLERPRWIPVTERLPEPLEDVLVYDPQDNRVAEAYMTRPKEWVGVRINHEVTHWMPLPEPPKEDAE